MRALPLLCALVLWASVSGSPGRAQDSGNAAAAPPLRLALLSDLNGPYGSLDYPAESHALLALALAQRPDALLLAGDLIAGQQASLSDARVRAMWGSFDALMSGVTVPFAPAMGNHDAAQARDRREAAAHWTAAPWTAHTPPLDFVSREGFPFAYSFVLARGDTRVFVAVIDATGAHPPAHTEAWLNAQLQTPQARGAAARLVMGHLPLAGVSQGRDRPGEVIAPARAAALAGVMRRHGVLAYVSGHHHAFFPGEWNGVRQIALTGVPPRELLNTPGSARVALAVLDIDPARGEARLSALDLQGRALDLNTLPARLNPAAGALTRTPARLPLP